MTQPASLAYRKARADIWDGRAPEKYTRLLPYVQGRWVLELGAAEGVLALLLASEPGVEEVIALEWRAGRHEEGRRLQDRWRALGHNVSRCTMICGDIRARLDLLETVETLVAVRSIYYLRDDAEPVLSVASRTVETVVLCGNKSRQARFRANPHDELGRFNRLASAEGMRALLERVGYRTMTVVDEGDPIVVGRHPRRA